MWQNYCNRNTEVGAMCFSTDVNKKEDIFIKVHLYEQQLNGKKSIILVNTIRPFVSVNLQEFSAWE